MTDRSEPGMLKLPKEWVVLRAVEDQAEIRLRLPDGLVHRLHYDYVSMTACNVPLAIEGAPREYVDGVWYSWHTKDMVTCLECLCELDKTYAHKYDVSNPCGEVSLGVYNVSSLHKLAFNDET